MIYYKQDALDFLTSLIVDRQRKVDELKYQLLKLSLNKDIEQIIKIATSRKYLIKDLQMLQDSYRFISDQIPKEIKEL